MLDLLPAHLPAKQRLPKAASPNGKIRTHAALVSGCAQCVLDPKINQATVDILLRNNVKVVIPQDQNCCGALYWHAGEGEKARRLAKKILSVFSGAPDIIISNAAGCGSCLQEYPFILKGDDQESEAKVFSSRVRDLSLFLDETGIKPPPPTAKPLRVVYQDACHLGHAQGVTAPPRNLLEMIPGVKVVEINHSDICCGSAGIYNLEQVDVAEQLGRAKADEIMAVDPDFVVSANIGCLAQLRCHLPSGPKIPEVLHLAVFLQRAYDNEL